MTHFGERAERQRQSTRGSPVTQTTQLITTRPVAVLADSGQLLTNSRRMSPRWLVSNGLFGSVIGLAGGACGFLDGVGAEPGVVQLNRRG
jgi:hypothetical protein